MVGVVGGLGRREGQRERLWFEDDDLIVIGRLLVVEISEGVEVLRGTEKWVGVDFLNGGKSERELWIHVGMVVVVVAKSRRGGGIGSKTHQVVDHVMMTTLFFHGRLGAH